MLARRIARVLNANPDTLVARWHAETHATYDPLKTTTAAAGDLRAPAHRRQG